MKTTIFKIMLLFFLLTQTSFVYSDTGDKLRELGHGLGKLWNMIWGGIGANSKNEDVKKVAKVAGKVGDIVMDVAGPEAAQRNKEAEERRIQMVNDAANKYRPQRLQSQQEKVSIEEKKDVKKQETDKYKIIFYNDSDYNIIVRDYIGNKTYTIGTIRAPEPIYRPDGTSFIARGAITITPTIENPFPYNFIEISTSDPNRNILDNSFSFVYNKDKVDWRLEGDFPFREARFSNVVKKDNYKEEHFVNETENKTEENKDLTLRNEGNVSNNVPSNNEYEIDTKPEVEKDSPLHNNGNNSSNVFLVNKNKNDSKTERNINITIYNNGGKSSNISLNNKNINDNKTEKNITITIHNDVDISSFTSLNNRNKLGENVNSLNNSSISINPPQGNIPKENNTPLPLINNFQVGRYYIQIGSYANVNTVNSEIAKIGAGFPVAVMKTNVVVNGKETLIYRILIGPLTYNELQNLFYKFNTVYNNAVIWFGG